MNIIQLNDLVLMNYIVKVKDGTVTETDREKVKAVVGDMDTYLAIFNDLIYIAKSSVVDEILTINEAFELVRREYELLEFDQYIPFLYLDGLTYLSINILYINSMSSDEIWEKIVTAIARLEECDNPELIHDLYYFMISLINAYGIAVSNLEITKQILDKIDSFHDTSIEIHLLPPYLFGF